MYLSYLSSLQLIVFDQTIFLFSLKVVMCWTSLEKLKFSWLPFFFGKVIHSPYDTAVGEHQSGTLFHSVCHHCPLRTLGPLCILLLFLVFHLGKLPCILLLLKVREEIEDWLQGCGVPWEKSSYIKALFRINYFVFWKSHCRHPCCFYWSYRFSTGPVRVWLCFGDWHILFEFAQNSTD